MYFVEIIKKETTKKVLIFIFICLLFYFMRNLFDLFLLTFMFTYLINSMDEFVYKNLRKIIPINKRIVTILIYILVFSLLSFSIYRYIPELIKEGGAIANEVSKIGTEKSPTAAEKYIRMLLDKIDLQQNMNNSISYAYKFASNIGRWGFNVFIALMLSLFFMLEKEKVHSFMNKFKNSKIKGFYRYFSMFGREFLDSFGKVIQAQILIAITNTVVSFIFLWIMGFPELLALAFMIFVLSLIPVAGVIISLIPLGLIAFKLGGLIKVAYVLIMIVVLHALESYVLNPKFMSDKTELPVFFTFVILIVSEHLMGMWGLLIGIPLFMFILNLIDVKIGE